MCETGAFKSVPVCAPSPAAATKWPFSRPALAVAAASPPRGHSGHPLRPWCGVAVSVTNNTRSRALQLAWRLPAAAAAANMVSLVVVVDDDFFLLVVVRRGLVVVLVVGAVGALRGVTGATLHAAEHRRAGRRHAVPGGGGRGASVETSVTALALAPGMHPIAGLVVVDEENGEEFPQRRSPRCSLRPRRLTPEQVRAASEARGRRPGAAAAAAAVVAAGSAATAAGWRWAGVARGQPARSGSYTTGNRSRSNSAGRHVVALSGALRSSSRSSSTALNDGGSDDNDVGNDEDDGVGEEALATSPALSPALLLLLLLLLLPQPRTASAWTTTIAAGARGRALSEEADDGRRRARRRI